MYSEPDAERRYIIPKKSGEDHEPYRTPWRRDLARIIHCPSFRRQSGKSQLFPGVDSDYFRTRLTHSLEVAQIGRSIAIRLNATEPQLRPKLMKIDPDVVEAACLVHDIGHAPFGHQGEMALDGAMKAHGGFEGNAQTLRILARLEKRDKHEADISGIDRHGVDQRCGLNLTARTLAGVLKYDAEIPHNRATSASLAKGYYSDDAEVVRFIKKCVVGNESFEGFKTIECAIMDVADDIAYSTYDVEDAIKARFITPAEITATRNEVLERVAKKVTTEYAREFPENPKTIGPSEIGEVLTRLFNQIFQEIPRDSAPHIAVALATRTSNEICESAYQRIALTSNLVGGFIRGVELIFNEDYPQLSKARLKPATFLEVEALKRFVYESIIQSPRISVVQHRSIQIVRRIIDSIIEVDAKGEALLPDDCRRVYNRIHSSRQERVACDFVASMTDRYATDFFGRLVSQDPTSIFAPI